MELDDRYETEVQVSRMGVPYLTSFLWCMSLKLGSKLISGLHCTISSAIVIACLLMVYDASHHLDRDDNSDGVYTHAFHVVLVITAASLAHVMLAFTLLYGVFWRKPLLIRIWVMVMSVLYVVAILFVVITAIVYGFSATGSDIFISFLEALLVFAFIAYSILCVYSYYLMLKSAEDLDHPNKTDY